ncbi:hypothetical protein C0J52_17916 [Blattella germanica]|nr:hypothetical protein C0J52_17916 [Blattella germanica]
MVTRVNKLDCFICINFGVPVDVFLFSPLAGEDVESPAFLSRVTRGAGKGNLFKNCCGQRDMPAFTQEDIETKKACKDEATELDIRKLGGRCLDDEGYVKEEEYAEAYAELHPPYMKSLVVACVADCIKINEKAKLMVDKWGVKCNPANSMMIDCMKAILEVKCPEDMQIKSPECNKRRQICAKKVQKKGYDPDD